MFHQTCLQIISFSTRAYDNIIINNKIYLFIFQIELSIWHKRQCLAMIQCYRHYSRTKHFRNDSVKETEMSTDYKRSLRISSLCFCEINASTGILQPLLRNVTTIYSIDVDISSKPHSKSRN